MEKGPKVQSQVFEAFKGRFRHSFTASLFLRCCELVLYRTMKTSYANYFLTAYELCQFGKLPQPLLWMRLHVPTRVLSPQFKVK